MEMIIRLQDNLSIIRKIAGWTTEELGKRIGVTKQTISNLENNKTKMTLTQYIAIRTILDYEIQMNTKNVLLKKVVDILLDEESISEEDNLKIKKTMETIAAAMAGGADPDVLQSIMNTVVKEPSRHVGSKIVGTVVGGTCGAVCGVLPGSLKWLPQIMKGVNNDE